MTTPDAPIGVFDSGLGGLSVLDAMHARLPDESMVYIADSGFAPYGEKSDTFIRRRSKAIADWLVERGAKMIVVACNTATTHAIGYLRETLPVPIVGVEPGIKPAALATASHVVGVLATAATLRSDRLKALIAEHEAQCRFVCQAGHGLVEQIEQGKIGGAIIDDLLVRYLTPMAEAGADTVILGSTHFALLADSIERLFGERFTLIETGSAIARRVEALLGAGVGRATAKAKVTHDTLTQEHDRVSYFSTAPSSLQRHALLAVVNRLPSMRTIASRVAFADIAHALADV